MVVEIDGVIPPLGQIHAGLEGDGKVVIYNLPDGVVSLDFLDPVVESVAHLSVYDGACRDISVLEKARGLRTIDITHVRPRRGGDFSTLPLIEASVAGCDAVASILRLPTLRLLFIGGPRPEDLVTLPPYLHRLYLRRRRGEVVLPPGDYLDHITHLTVYSVERLDTRHVIHAPKLSMVEIDSVRRWDGAAQMATTPLLGWLYLRNVLDIDDPAALRGVATGDVNVEGKHVFSPALREELLSSRPPTWTFPPAANRYIGTA